MRAVVFDHYTRQFGLDVEHYDAFRDLLADMNRKPACVTDKGHPSVIEAFKLFDKDGNGTINRIDSGALHPDIAVCVSNSVNDSLINELVSRNGVLTFSSLTAKLEGRTRMRAEVFDHYTNLLGLSSNQHPAFSQTLYTLKAIPTCVNTLGHPLVEAAFHAFDINGDGRISFDDSNTPPPPEPQLQSFIFEKRVSSHGDDAEERSNGSVNTGSSDLELINDGGDQLVGIRFTNISIPKGARITNAYIQFTVDERSTGSSDLRVFGQDSDNADRFTSTKRRNISSRPKTHTSAHWVPRPWGRVGDSGSDQRTTQLRYIVEEVINRPGWRTGNSLVFIIQGQGKRVAESFNGSSRQAPLLRIEYEAEAQ